MLGVEAESALVPRGLDDRRQFLEPPTDGVTSASSVLEYEGTPARGLAGQGHQQSLDDLVEARLETSASVAAHVQDQTRRPMAVAIAKLAVKRRHERFRTS